MRRCWGTREYTTFAVSTRTCYCCYTARPTSGFITRVDDRHYRICRACVSGILLCRSNGKKRLPHTPSHRVCYLCRRTLPNSAFTRRSNETYFSACKECNRHVFAQRRRARLQAASGEYTVAEWDALLALYTRCPMCLRAWADIPPSPGGVVVTVDRIIPLARRGSNSIDKSSRCATRATPSEVTA